MVSPLAVSKCLGSRKGVPQNSILGPSSLEAGETPPYQTLRSAGVSEGPSPVPTLQAQVSSPPVAAAGTGAQVTGGERTRIYQLRCSLLVQCTRWARDLNPDLVTPRAGPGRVSQETATPGLGNPGQVFLPQYLAELAPLPALSSPSKCNSSRLPRGPLPRRHPHFHPSPSQLPTVGQALC